MASHFFSVVTHVPSPHTFLERQNQLPPQARGGTQHRHDPHRNSNSNPQPGGHSCEDCAQYLLDDDIRGEKEGDDNRGYQEHIGPARLRGRRHELGIIEAEEEADGEEGEEAAVEGLSYQDYQGAVSCRKKSRKMIVCTFPFLQLTISTDDCCGDDDLYQYYPEVD